MQKEREVLISRSFLQIALQLTQETDIDPILIAIVERSMELTGARFGAAVTVADDLNIERFIHRGLSDEEVAALPHLPEGHGLLGAVLAQKESIRCERIDEHPGSIGFPSAHVPMHAFLGVPIAQHNKLSGALYLTKSPEAPPFTEDDTELIEAMASLAAVGIENSRNIERERRRAELTDSIRRISMRVKNSLDVGEVLATTVEELGQMADVARCSIRMVEAPGATAIGPIEHEWTSPGITPLAGTQVVYPIASSAALTRTTQWSDDLSIDERFTGPDFPEVLPLLKRDTRAVLAAPLQWGDELLGVIVFHSLEPRRWTKEDVALIEGAAREVGNAMHHAQLYEEAVDTVGELRELEQRRADYISMVSHEIRSPITVVAGIADILKRRRSRLDDAGIDELVDSLEREASRLARLVNEVLDLERIDRGGMNLVLKPLDVVDLAQESIEDTGESSRLALASFTDEAPVLGDRDKLKQVFVNLISNALKFAPEETPVTVSISIEDEIVRIGVRDEGPGIAEEDKELLFKRFSRLDPTLTKPGSGLGLYLSRLIVDRHGGKIWAESQVGEGATFYFTLPVSS